MADDLEKRSNQLQGFSLVSAFMLSVLLLSVATCYEQYQDQSEQDQNNTRHFRLVVLCKDVRVCKGHQYLIGTQVQLCCLLLVCFQLLAERYRV